MAKNGLYRQQRLTEDVLQEITELAKICNAYEELDLKLNWDALRNRRSDRTSDFLYYADDKLVGFLPLFAMISVEAEVSGMVHPEYRRRGIFTQLWQEAQAECQRRQLPRVLFIVEHRSTGGQSFVAALSTRYDHSEYKMVLDEPKWPEKRNEQLEFRPSHSDEASILGDITAEAFHLPGENVDWYNEDALLSPTQRYYVGVVDGIVVGKIDVWLRPEQALLLGFAVRPAYQGRGYGRAILAQTLREVLAEGPRTVVLEVETRNKQALNLYQSCGFRETSSYDYYALQL